MGNIYWKVYGPDLNGTFGGMQGTGGLEATILDSGGTATGVINDYFGNDVATVSGGSVTWSSTHVGSYGALPGNIASPLTSAAQLAQTIGWRGHYIDPTGFYNLGARAYEPVSGRFLSCDPLGYAASTSLYNFCNGDAVNSFDADGRCPIDPGPTGSNDNGSDLGPTDTPILDAAMNLTDSNYDTSSGYSGVSNLTNWGGNAQDPNAQDSNNGGPYYVLNNPGSDQSDWLNSFNYNYANANTNTFAFITVSNGGAVQQERNDNGTPVAFVGNDVQMSVDVYNVDGSTPSSNDIRIDQEIVSHSMTIAGTDVPQPQNVLDNGGDWWNGTNWNDSKGYQQGLQMTNNGPVYPSVSTNGNALNFSFGDTPGLLLTPDRLPVT